MQVKERCFRIPAMFAGFSSNLFGAALSFFFAEPPTYDAISTLRGEIGGGGEIVQKKLSFSECDTEMVSTIKDVYKIENDYEAVSLVIAYAVRHNPLFA